MRCAKRSLWYNNGMRKLRFLGRSSVSSSHALASLDTISTLSIGSKMEWKGALSAQSQNHIVSTLTPVFAANCHADAIARILLASPPEGTKRSFPVFIAFDFVLYWMQIAMIMVVGCTPISRQWLIVKQLYVAFRSSFCLLVWVHITRVSLPKVEWNGRNVPSHGCLFHDVEHILLIFLRLFWRFLLFFQVALIV